MCYHILLITKVFSSLLWLSSLVTTWRFWDICHKAECFHLCNVTVYCFLSALVLLPWWWWWWWWWCKSDLNMLVTNNMITYVLYVCICWFFCISLNINYVPYIRINSKSKVCSNNWLQSRGIGFDTGQCHRPYLKHIFILTTFQSV